MALDIDAIRAAAAADPALAVAARLVTVIVVLEMGEDAYLLAFEDGRVARFEPCEPGTAADLIVSGPAASWAKLLQPVPPPGFQDLLRRGEPSGFRFAGDLLGVMAPCYHAVQEFVEVVRRVRNGGAPDGVLPEVDRDFDRAVGRYMYVRVHGVQYRVYYEEAGEGDIPLLLQHTAGADGRQWRHLLEDPDYGRRYRMIAYDLPFHGRSLPPTSHPWWTERYVLRREFLMDMVVAIARRLELDRPVFMGCSVGGMLAPDLALYRPDAFRAVIGLNGGLGIDPSTLTPGVEESYTHPRINAQWKAALMRANTAPTSPDAYRRETSWVYSQGAPPVLEGDVFYYSHDHDLTAGQAARIDTEKVAVYLLTGEYDLLAGAEGTARLAEAVKGSRFQIAPGLGHFGPSENPDDFKAVLLPVLEEIAAAG